MRRVEQDAQLWKEVFLFAAEREGETASRFYTLLDALIPDDPEEPPDIDRMRLAILAGDALVRTDRHEGELGRHASKLERVRKWLTLALTEASLDAPARAEAGRYLGTIGDKRSGVGLRPDGVPDIDWVPIPAGTFLMGSTDDDENAYGDEKPQRKIELPAFRIARYPVTMRSIERSSTTAAIRRSGNEPGRRKGGAGRKIVQDHGTTAAFSRLPITRAWA